MSMMKAVSRAAALWMLACALGGCLVVDDHLTLNGDGSGMVVISVQPQVPMEHLRVMDHQLSQVPTRYAYPPVSEQQARRLFPGEDFKLEFKHETDGGNPRFVTTARFTDVNKLLVSPYGAARSLRVAADPATEQITVEAASGLQVLGTLEGNAALRHLPFDADGFKAAMQKAKATYRITLAGAKAAEGPGAAVEDGAATWNISAAAITPGAFAAALREPMIVTASAEGVTFTPVSIVRLDLQPFDKAPEGLTGSDTAEVDIARITKAAKFVPTFVQVVSTFDLSGDAGGYEDGGVLSGKITIPREMAPQRWGKLQLRKVVDDQGRSLMPQGDDSRYSRFDMMGGTQGTDAGNVASHPVVIHFTPPLRSVQYLAEIEAVVPLEYATGQRRVVKLPFVLAEAAIKSLGEDDFMMMQMQQGSPPSAEQKKVFQQAELNLVGISAGRQEGLIMVSLSMRRPGAVVDEVQVFDAEGKPWPTILLPDQFAESMGAGSADEETQMKLFYVMGKPEPPLSLAMIVRLGQTSIMLPISLRNLPLNPEAQGQPSETGSER